MMQRRLQASRHGGHGHCRSRAHRPSNNSGGAASQNQAGGNLRGLLISLGFKQLARGLHAVLEVCWRSCSVQGETAALLAAMTMMGIV
jgi:hypothetical protein